MFKAVDKWGLGYLRSLFSRPRRVKGTRHLIFSICDHFEPFRGGADVSVARQTVRDWLAAYPGAVDSFRDADGHPPRHTFFYPQEEYDAVILDDLAAFCRKGYGEVEIHLHHRHDTPEGFREKLVTFRDLLHERHGLLGETVGLGREENTPHPNPLPQGERGNQPSCSKGAEESLLPLPLGERVGVRVSSSSSSSSTRYAFIHGNWALCNSRPDGDWCGVNEELGILAETGCYADFTFPSAPSPTQPRMVNALYYACDAPGHPRGADRGSKVISYPLLVIGKKTKSDSASGLMTNNESPITNNAGGRRRLRLLLLITGPLALNWCRRKWGIFPRLENAEISGANPPAADRIRLWARQQIHVGGRPDWVFVKLHTHGCVPANQAVLLGQAMQQAHVILQQEFNDGANWRLHYVTAREMANLVKAAEVNLSGTPGQYRDYWVGPPPLSGMPIA